MKTFKKKILWITPDYFLCVDAFIVPKLMYEYEINWILINSRNTERKLDGLVVDSFKPIEVNLKYRQRDPRIILSYIRLINKIRKADSDLIYLSFHGLPYFFPPFFFFVNNNKVIYGAHNVSTPKGASEERAMRIYHKYAYSRLKNFHVFSKSQLNTIRKLLTKKNFYYAPLALEDYGTSNVSPPNDVIRFLFFGYIKEYKRLDLLLKAFQNLYNSKINNIELYIAGYCKNWDYYEKMITKKDGIKTRIEIIPNKEIPDLISSCHYMVLPYQDIAQSAVLTLAYQYNKPIIASDLGSFKEFIVEGSTGYFFKSQSCESLTLVLREVVLKHNSNYTKLKRNIKTFVDKEYSINEIISKYKYFLNDCIARYSREKY